jgi:ATP-dependent DNA helicase RecQ
VVYDLRVRDNRRGPLIEALLRLHGGLFEEPAVIDEGRTARLLNITVDKVVHLLKDLDRQRVLMYRPRSDAPRVTLLTPRLDAARMTLDPAAHRDRLQRATDRLQAMIDFLRGQECRMRMLLRYFGEYPSADCGRCDRCVQRARSAAGTMNEPRPLPDDAQALERLRWEIDGSIG